MLLLNDNDVKKYILIFINRLGHCPLVICILNSLKRSHQSTKSGFAAWVSMRRVQIKPTQSLTSWLLLLREFKMQMTNGLCPNHIYTHQ